MADLDKRIAELEEMIKDYHADLKTATSVQEKSEIRQMIISTRGTLNRLLDEKNSRNIIIRSNLNVNTSPHRVLGDDQDGPHSSAIIIGRRTVLACAHSLGLLVDKSQKNTKTLTHFKYLEDYWIQPSFTRNVTGELTTDNRIPLKLYKFHVSNDWALLVRADDNYFAADEMASIDQSPILQPSGLTQMEAVGLHCPVSLKSAITRAEEFSVGCMTSSVRIQTHSNHHVKYKGRDLCRGSSGGGIYVSSNLVLGMHVEAINETDYDADAVERVIANTGNRVFSEDKPYLQIETSNPPATKKMKIDSETIASLAGGNNGLGSAIIICKFSRLMHYIEELENS